MSAHRKKPLSPDPSSSRLEGNFVERFLYGFSAVGGAVLICCGLYTWDLKGSFIAAMFSGIIAGLVASVGRKPLKYVVAFAKALLSS